MSAFRLVAVLSLLLAACYRDAPSRSTMPEPAYFAGPPGGQPDPGTAYGPGANEPDPATAQPAEEAEDPDDLAEPEEAEAPSEIAPPVASPTPAPRAAEPDIGAPEPGEQIGEAPAPAAPQDPTGSVRDAEIEAALDGHGQWIDTDDYGQVWRPDATEVGVDFTPYESGGSWQPTEAGWAFACDYPWGWLPFHYGRWAWFHDYWGWVPGHRWGPAWVEWRHGGGVVGWRPMRPRVVDHRDGHRDGYSDGHRDGHRDDHGDGYRDPRPGPERRFGQSRPLIRDHRHAEQHDAHWRFATESDFARPHVRSHLYGDLAEGLRVTSRVAAPPVRARTTTRAADLMRSRFAPVGRDGAPGRFGAPVVRDHRAIAAPPAQAWRAQPYGTPSRAYPPVSRGDGSAMRGYQAPYRGAPPPAGGISPSVRSASPPARWGGPPPRAYQPPARSFQPPPIRGYRPGPYSPPSRSYSPPQRSYSPPSRSYSPPSRSSGSSGSSGSTGSRGSSGSSGGSSRGSSGGSSGSSHGGGRRGR